MLILYLFIPISVFAYSDYIIASGKNIGIELKSKGIIIVDTYKIQDKDPAMDAGLRSGDKIFSINNKEVSSIDEMLNIINMYDDKSNVLIGFYRGSKQCLLHLI